MVTIFGFIVCCIVFEFSWSELTYVSYLCALCEWCRVCTFSCLLCRLILKCCLQAISKKKEDEVTEKLPTAPAPPPMIPNNGKCCNLIR